MQGSYGGQEQSVERLKSCIADLKKLEGLKLGFSNPIAMLDGFGFDGAKAYKDSKLCLMMLSNLLHDKYHKQTGIAFSAIYPGCIAESPLFREKRPWFRKYFPIFMKYITGGFVGEEEAGMRLFQVAHDPRCAKSGVYWSWNGGPREGRGDEALEKDGQILGGGGAGGGWESIYENDQSDKVLDTERAQELFRGSTEVTGAQWPSPNQPKSPCPTLKVVGAVTAFVNAKEEMKRLQPGPGVVGGLTKVGGTTAAVADKVVTHTAGRVARMAQSKLLGALPTEAVEGSFQEEREKETRQKEKRQKRRASGGRGGFFSRLRREKESASAEREVADVDAQITEALGDEGLVLPKTDVEFLESCLESPDADGCAVALAGIDGGAA